MPAANSKKTEKKSAAPKTAAKAAPAKTKAPAAPKKAKTTATAKSKPAAAAAPAKAAKTSRPPVSADQRRNYVEVAAYYIAERRGFDGGDALDDWAAAEEEIDRLLAAGLLNT